MNERLLQYIWQFQYFNGKELQLSSGESLQIIHQGHWNEHQGPDFLQATIKIGETKWIGSIELHVLTSDWFRHAHQFDKNYKNVILHVVWKHDMDGEQSTTPVLALEDKVPKMLLSQYEDWMNNRFFIPCRQQIQTINDITWIAWKQRLVVERLQRKGIIIQEYLGQCNHHWEEVFWWLLARNFGIKVNADAFEAIARSLPVKVLVRHKNQVIQLEALLLGQAGLLEPTFEEQYPVMLQKEYKFYRNKYKLSPICQPIHFLRMRPENFPTIRLAQLAMLVHESSHLFSRILEMQAVSEIKKLLNVTANDYWHYHYRPDEPSAYKPKKPGGQMVNNIIINTIVPIVFAFGNFYQKNIYMEKSIRWLEEIAAENNNITRQFADAGISGNSAFDSQAVLELKSSYCDQRRCLDCTVGNALLRLRD